MKIDMHCHVKEGSIDSKVSLEDYITLLKKKGFQGMVITDHDTYNGYRYWKKNLKGKKHTDFVVLKGIEYDTRDAGHILVIMPEGVKMRLLEMRGMPLALLIDLVHRNGGVLGPAHPCGEKYMSFTHARRREDAAFRDAGNAGIAADRSGASKRRCAWTGTSVRRKVYEYR